MSTRRIIEDFERLRAAGQALALATVCTTEGSTYSKAGHRILLTPDGGHCGLISGGCLEPDIAAHAAGVLQSGHARTIEYDLRDGDEELFGLALGCRGALRILLQPLDPAADYEPFSSMSAWMRAGREAVTSVVIGADGPEPMPGTTLLDSVPEQIHPGVDPDLARSLRKAISDAELPADGVHSIVVDGRRCEVLRTALPCIPRLLVLGAGADAIPLVRLAVETGWRVTVADHRPTRVVGDALSVADRRVHLQPAALARELPLARFDAVVVMSHHLPSDRAYLKALAASPVPYIGLLGPRARRDELLEALGEHIADALRGRLHGPAGLAIGADSPETIALSILAEIESRRHRPTGRNGSPDP